MVNHISSKDLEEFREAIEMWRDYFGISCFDIYVEAGELGDGTIADVSRCVDTRSAVVRLHSLPPGEDRSEAIDSTARHEMIHVLLADLSALAHDRSATAEMIEREEERLVVKLCRLFE
jgi:hypothetical protein